MVLQKYDIGLMLLHVITACIRPGNLPLLHDSFLQAAENKTVDLRWHISMESRGNREPKHPDVSYSKFPTTTYLGDLDNSPINRPLQSITDGWICWVDDDNLMHPEFISGILEHCDEPQILVYHQQLTKRPALFNPLIRYVDNGSCRPGRIDTGQFCIHSRLLEGIRWNGSHPQPDGLFVQAVHNRYPTKVKTVNQVLAYYNQLA